MLAGTMHPLSIHVNKNLGKEKFLFLLGLRHLYLLALEHQKSKLLSLHIFITEILRHTSCDLVFTSLEAHRVTPLASLIFPISEYLGTPEHL